MRPFLWFAGFTAIFQMASGHGRRIKRFRLNFAHWSIILAMISGRIQCPLFYFIANSKVVGMINEFTCEFTRTKYVCTVYIIFLVFNTPSMAERQSDERDINLNEVWIIEFKSSSQTFTSDVNRSKLMMLNGCAVMWWRQLYSDEGENHLRKSSKSFL